MNYRLAKKELNRILDRAKALESQHVNDVHLIPLYSSCSLVINQFFPSLGAPGGRHFYSLRLEETRINDNKKSFSAEIKLQNIIQILKDILKDIDLQHHTHQWTAKEIDEVTDKLLPLLNGQKTIQEILSNELFDEFHFLAKGPRGYVTNLENLIQFLKDENLITYGTRVIKESSRSTKIEMLSLTGKGILDNQGGWLIKRERDRKNIKKQGQTGKSYGLTGTADPAPTSSRSYTIAPPPKEVNNPENIWTKENLDATADVVVRELKWGAEISITELLSNKLYNYVKFLPRNRHGKVAAWELISYMLEMGLITKDNKDTEKLSKKGLEVQNAGGYLTYLNAGSKKRIGETRNNSPNPFSNLLKKLQAEIPRIGPNDEGQAYSLYFETRELIANSFGRDHRYNLDLARIWKVSGSLRYKLQQIIPLIEAISMTTPSSIQTLYEDRQKLLNGDLPIQDAGERNGIEDSGINPALRKTKRQDSRGTWLKTAWQKGTTDAFTKIVSWCIIAVVSLTLIYGLAWLFGVNVIEFLKTNGFL